MAWYISPLLPIRLLTTSIRCSVHKMTQDTYRAVLPKPSSSRRLVSNSTRCSVPTVVVFTLFAAVLVAFQRSYPSYVPTSHSCPPQWNIAPFLMSRRAALVNNPVNLQYTIKRSLVEMWYLCSACIVLSCMHPTCGQDSYIQRRLMYLGRTSATSLSMYPSSNSIASTAPCLTNSNTSL